MPTEAAQKSPETTVGHTPSAFVAATSTAYLERIAYGHASARPSSRREAIAELKARGAFKDMFARAGLVRVSL